MPIPNTSNSVLSQPTNRNISLVFLELLIKCLFGDERGKARQFFWYTLIFKITGFATVSFIIMWLNCYGAAFNSAHVVYLGKAKPNIINPIHSPHPSITSSIKHSKINHSNIFSTRWRHLNIRASDYGRLLPHWRKAVPSLSPSTL